MSAGRGQDSGGTSPRASPEAHDGAFRPAREADAAAAAEHRVADVARLLRHDAGHAALSKADARALAHELARYLALAANSAPGRAGRLSPSEEVDAEWHVLLTHPFLYLEVCAAARGVDPLTYRPLAAADADAARAAAAAGGAAGGGSAPANRAGAAVARSTRNGALYCGRILGRGAIPGSDGQCGPSDGPQCADCAALVTAVNRAGVAMARGGRAGAMYCGRALGREAIPGSDGQCGPGDGPQCADCAAFGAAPHALLAHEVIIGHNPARARNSVAVKQARYAATLAEYLHVFGAPPPSRWWPPYVSADEAAHAAAGAAARGAAAAHATAAAAAGQPRMRVLVKTLTGETVVLDNCFGSMTAEDVKQMIQDVEGIPPEQQRLIFNGEQLQGLTLADVGVSDGSVLHLALRLRC